MVRPAQSVSYFASRRLVRDPFQLDVGRLCHLLATDSVRLIKLVKQTEPSFSTVRRHLGDAICLGWPIFDLGQVYLQAMEEKPHILCVDQSTRLDRGIWAYQQSRGIERVFSYGECY